jgi:hypothetical protein
VFVCLRSPEYLAAVTPLMSHHDDRVRAAVGRAVAGFMQVHQPTAGDTLSDLIAIFDKHSSGLALTKTTSWMPRQAVAAAIGAAATRGVRRCVLNVIVVRAGCPCAAALLVSRTDYAPAQTPPAARCSACCCCFG